MRKKVPQEIETEVLIKSGRRCCLCFGINHDVTEKSGQIAHLDQNNENFSFENLAYLCLEHHDSYDSSHRQSKGYSMSEVKKYRASLYEYVEEQHRTKGQFSALQKGQSEKTKFLIGPQLKELRGELGISTSEFVELVGLHSEKTYLQMEANEQECDISIIEQIAETTGVFPEWIKHGHWRELQKYKVEPLVFVHEDNQKAFDAVQKIMEVSNGGVYVTIAVSTSKSDFPFWYLKNLVLQITGDYLHMGLIVPVSKYKYNIYETYMCLGILDDFKRKYYAKPLFLFLNGLWDNFGLDLRGIIISNLKDEKDLYAGRVHPKKILAKHFFTHRTDWVQAVLNFNRRNDREYYDKYGAWIRNVQAAFKEINQW